LLIAFLIESLFVVATLLGHSSTRMVEKVYGRLDQATLNAAISRLPGANAPQPTATAGVTADSRCHAGVTALPKNGGEHGTSGTAIAQAALTNSVEEALHQKRGQDAPGRGISP
jgi:hypothetical protein